MPVTHELSSMLNAYKSQSFGEKKECKATDLTYDDITIFHHYVNSLNKVDQNKVLLKFMETIGVKFACGVQGSPPQLLLIL